MLQATDVFSEFLMRYANVVSDDASFWFNSSYNGMALHGTVMYFHGVEFAKRLINDVYVAVIFGEIKQKQLKHSFCVLFYLIFFSLQSNELRFKVFH